MIKSNPKEKKGFRLGYELETQAFRKKGGSSALNQYLYQDFVRMESDIFLRKEPFITMRDKLKLGRRHWKILKRAIKWFASISWSEVKRSFANPNIQELVKTIESKTGETYTWFSVSLLFSDTKNLVRHGAISVPDAPFAREISSAIRDYAHRYASALPIPRSFYENRELNASEAYDSLREHTKSGFDTSTDMTVSGPEIKLTAPLSYEDAVESMKELFSKYEYDVDERCSFHIHLSFEGRKHGWGHNMQYSMCEYLYEHMDEVPTHVLHRWVDVLEPRWSKKKSSERQLEARGSYFKIGLGDDKYYFVAFRQEYGTWEFRCFGNVQLPSEAAQCMLLAIEAYAYGYANRERYDYEEAEHRMDNLKRDIPARAASILDAQLKGAKVKKVKINNPHLVKQFLIERGQK